MICSLTGNILFPNWEYFPNRQGKRQPSLSRNIIDFSPWTYFYWVATAIGVVRSLADLGSMSIKNALSHYSGVFHRPRSFLLYYVSRWQRYEKNRNDQIKLEKNYAKTRKSVEKSPKCLRKSHFASKNGDFNTRFAFFSYLCGHEGKRRKGQVSLYHARGIWWAHEAHQQTESNEPDSGYLDVDHNNIITSKIAPAILAGYQLRQRYRQ